MKLPYLFDDGVDDEHLWLVHRHAHEEHTNPGTTTNAVLIQRIPHRDNPKPSNPGLVTDNPLDDDDWQRTIDLIVLAPDMCELLENIEKVNTIQDLVAYKAKVRDLLGRLKVGMPEGYDDDPED